MEPVDSVYVPTAPYYLNFISRQVGRDEGRALRAGPKGGGEPQGAHQGAGRGADGPGAGAGRGVGGRGDALLPLASRAPGPMCVGARYGRAGKQKLGTKDDERDEA